MKMRSQPMQIRSVNWPCDWGLPSRDASFSQKPGICFVISWLCVDSKHQQITYLPCLVICCHFKHQSLYWLWCFQTPHSVIGADWRMCDSTLGDWKHRTSCLVFGNAKLDDWRMRLKIDCQESSPTHSFSLPLIPSSTFGGVRYCDSGA